MAYSWTFVLCHFETKTNNILQGKKILSCEKSSKCYYYLYSYSPRRIICRSSKTGHEITYTLWSDPDKDASNEDKIQKIMGKRCVFRKARVKYFSLFQEYQFSLPLYNVKLRKCTLETE